MKINLYYKFLFILFLYFSCAQSNQDEIGDEKLIYIYHDKPMYFLIGKQESKIQFSFKIKIVANAKLYVSYNQKVIWLLFNKSSPFKDVNYNPAVYYRFHSV